MPYSGPNHWTDNPNAPNITYNIYLAERELFAGFVASAIFYGIVVILFFRCMDALFNPTNRANGGIKWPLVFHTVAMFSFATVDTALNSDLQSICYVDNRDFTGVDRRLPSGPIGYQQFVYSAAITVVPNITFLLNTCLADGLLLYRCWVIYGSNYWAIAFPCLMYLASFAMGVILVYYEILQRFTNHSSNIIFGTPYFTISLSLTVILTIMIVIRLTLYNRRIRRAIGAKTTTSGVYTTVIAMLVESYALYAVNFLLFIGAWGAGNDVANLFSPILIQTQVIAPFLIILRVANRTAFTSDTIAPRTVGSIHFRSHGRSTDVDETLPGGSLICPTETNLGLGAESTIDEVAI